MKTIEERKKTRNRKIISFNVPFCMNMETNFVQTLLKLVKKHFPRHSSFHMIFNKRTIKVRYSCMRYISLIVGPHKSILGHKAKYGCNCRNEESCLLQHKCLTSEVIYDAAVTNNTEDEKRLYFGA